MKATPTAIPDVMVIEPKVFGDARGFFYESFNQQAFNAATGTNLEFVQDNHSRSSKGVLRGLHYQLPPNAQGRIYQSYTYPMYSQQKHRIIQNGRRSKT